MPLGEQFLPCSDCTSLYPVGDCPGEKRGSRELVLQEQPTQTMQIVHFIILNIESMWKNTSMGQQGPSNKAPM